MRALVTGGSGFIGSALLRYLILEKETPCLNIDKLTYAANPDALLSVQSNPLYQFKQIDINDAQALSLALREFSPDVLFHLAAESHVDRSINGSTPFIQTNILGTHTLLEETFKWWTEKGSGEHFRLIHVSTDEVYGSLSETSSPFQETDAYRPNSPYSASKAASDHLVRAWHKTYDLPVIITNCSNNYGPFQHWEKLIPTVVRTALGNNPIPVYGKGKNVRDWLYVEDHVKGLFLAAENGATGEKYNFGGNEEWKNLDLVEKICEILDQQSPKKNGGSYSEQITFVTDRPGHDFRYAIDSTKANNNLRWEPESTFVEGLTKTVLWLTKEYHERNHSCGRTRNTSLSSDRVFM